MKALILNSGSSSQKSSLFELNDPIPSEPAEPLWQAKIEWQGGAADIEVESRGKKTKSHIQVSDQQEALRQLLNSLWSGETAVIGRAADIDVVGHRIVHGGPELKDPVRVTPEIKQAIKDVEPFAPLHNRIELAGIESIEKLLGTVPQVCVFDTGFHRTLPLQVATYPGPYEWFERGIRKYGFHGINHEYCARRTAKLLQRDLQSLRIISCHLGNGCSLAAIRNAESIDTTMGFTPLEGLMMGTRSGSVDPGILTYLIRKDHATDKDLDDTLNKRSGLLGISGSSEDMREILIAMGKNNARASLAFDMYVYRLRSGIGSMAAALGGVDALIFTAGVGEHSPDVRAAACDGLGFLGLELDPDQNAKSPGDSLISSSKSKTSVLIVKAQEDWAIAGECWKIMNEPGESN